MSAAALDQREKLFPEVVERIVQAIDPVKVIVFGSRARGDHRPHSDLDILVIAESAEPRYRRAGPLYRALAHLPLEIDVLVYTPQEVHEWSSVEQAFVTTATREGIVVYERTP